MRQSKIENYMEMAEVIAKRSHDNETKVGAILVNSTSNAIIATGYNGFVRHAPDAILPRERPAKYEYIVHAEQNLIANCARHGISMSNCTLVCTLSPCKLCMRLLFNCGITEVVVKTLYKDFDDILAMKDIKVQITQDEHGFHRIKYET